MDTCVESLETRHITGGVCRITVQVFVDEFVEEARRRKLISCEGIETTLKIYCMDLHDSSISSQKKMVIWKSLSEGCLDRCTTGS